MTTPTRAKSPFEDMPSCRKRGRPTRARPGLLAAGLLGRPRRWRPAATTRWTTPSSWSPGTCQVESWLTRGSDQRAPAARGRRLPRRTVRAGGRGGTRTRRRRAARPATRCKASGRPRFCPASMRACRSPASGRPMRGPVIRPRPWWASFSWFPREDLAFHLNLGRDFLQGQADEDRSGVSGGMGRPARAGHSRASATSKPARISRARACAGRSTKHGAWT